MAEFQKDNYETVVNDSVAKVTYTDREVYFTEEVTEDACKAQNAHDKSYDEQATTASSELALSMFKKNKDLEKVVVVHPFSTGKGTITTTVNRSVTHHIPGSDKTVTKSSVKSDRVNPDSNMAKNFVKKAAIPLTEALIANN